jgi:hypothetical protein
MREFVARATVADGVDASVRVRQMLFHFHAVGSRPDHELVTITAARNRSFPAVDLDMLFGHTNSSRYMLFGHTNSRCDILVGGQ